MRVFASCNRQLESIYCNRDKESEWIVLEAGGGSFSHFLLPNHYTLVALDISHGQLLRNQSTASRLQGDLEHLPLKANSVDLTICFNVIEHLYYPEKALDYLVNSLRPGGILILGCPSRNSLKGLVTRFTPLWFHRLYYRIIVEKKDRGEGHFDAFATPFRPFIAKRSLLKWFSQNGMSIEYLDAYDGAAEYQLVNGNWMSRLFAIPYYTFASLGWLFTLGKWRAADSDILLIARKFDD